MPRLTTYDAKRVVITLGSHTVSGYGEDTFINIAPVGDGTQSLAGADGEVARSMDNNPLREITLTVLQSSETNDFLSDMLNMDRATGRGYFPLQVLDLNGTTQFAASQAWVANIPEVSFGAAVEEREWTIHAVESSDTHIGGNRL